MLFARLRTLFALQAEIRTLQAQMRNVETIQHQQIAEHSKLDLAFESFRGRVYAWRRGQTPYPTPDEAAPAAPREPNPADPSLTKAQARDLLQRQGRLKPTRQ